MNERTESLLHSLCFHSTSSWQIVDPRSHLDESSKKPNPNHDRLLDFDTSPTWLVTELFIKTKTSSRRVPYVDVVSKELPGLGGPRSATHFASHSWRTMFTDLISAFEDFEAEGDFTGLTGCNWLTSSLATIGSLAHWLTGCNWLTGSLAHWLQVLHAWYCQITETVAVPI